MEKEDYYEISGLHFFSDYSSSKESIIILRVKDGKLEVIAERLFGGLVLGIMLTITIVGAIIGVPIIVLAPLAAWIWGIVTGAKLIQESSK